MITLKDLVKEADELSFGGYTQDTLQETARVWLKEMEEKGGYHEQTKWWIKTFFNLEDKDE